MSTAKNLDPEIKRLSTSSAYGLVKRVYVSESLGIHLSVFPAYLV